MTSRARIEHMDDHTGYLIIKVAGMAVPAFERALVSLGLNTRQVRVLGFLHGESLSQAELCARTGLDRTTMVAVLDELEQLGHATRERSKSDRRKHVVRITRNGKAAYAKATKKLLRAQEELLQPLAPAERAQLHALLSRLFDASQACAPEPAAEVVS